MQLKLTRRARKQLVSNFDETWYNVKLYTQTNPGKILEAYGMRKIKYITELQIVRRFNPRPTSQNQN